MRWWPTSSRSRLHEVANQVPSHEKISLAWYLDGRVSAVVGTHTHVQTADGRVLPGGTAFLCDGGFTGPHDSVIGREVEPVVRRFLTNTPQKFEVATNDVLLQGALIEIDDESGKACRICRVSRPLGADPKAAMGLGLEESH